MSTLRFRTEAEVECELTALTADGRSRAVVVRAAILEAERRLRRTRLQAEAESLRGDADDVAASRELAREMAAVQFC